MNVTGPIAAASQWARIQLVQGVSPTGLWDLNSTQGESRMTVGTSPNATWVVQAPHMSEVHFEFYWDGQALWISPPQGDLTVDGERVTNWRQIVGRCRLEFGGAAMLAETSTIVAAPVDTAPSVALPIVPPPPPSPRVRPPAPPARPAVQPAQGHSFATALAGAPPELVGDATRVLDGYDVPARTARTAPLPPTQQMPLVTGAMLSPMAPMATQILDLESAMLPSGFGDDEPPTQVFGGSPLGSRSTNPPPLGERPGLASSRAETDVLPKEQSRFQAPPALELKESGKLEMPPKRTLILAGITLLAMLGLFALSSVQNSREDEARRAARVAALAAEEARAEEVAAQTVAVAAERAAQRVAAEVAAAAQGGARTADARQAARDAYLESIIGLDEPPTDEEVEAAIQTAERLAAHHYAAGVLGRNDRRAAYNVYMFLSETYSRPEYETIAEILGQQLACEGTDCP